MEVYTDKMGRSFCDAHRRESCMACQLDFKIMNDEVEIQCGAKKPYTEVERLTKDKVTLERGIKFMDEQMAGQDKNRHPMTKNYKFHKKELKRVNEELEKHDKNEVEQGLSIAYEKAYNQDAIMNSLKQAWAAENPGATEMPFDGEETARLYEKFASAPNENEKNLDPRTCAYCRKVSTELLQVCGRCKKKFYCNRDCQKSAWKGHKLECEPTKKELSKSEKEKIEQVPLSWEQLHAYGVEVPAIGKVLEVRAISDDSLMRQVLACKDRTGGVRRIAAYTNQSKIPGFEVGKILRWKNPRYHYFMDGSSGARIEDDDLENITIISN